MSVVRQVVPLVPSSSPRKEQSKELKTFSWKGHCGQIRCELFRTEASVVELASFSGYSPFSIILKTITLSNETIAEKALSELHFLKTLSATPKSPFIVDFYFAAQPSSTELTLGMEYCAGGDLYGLLYSPTYADILAGFKVFDIVLYLAEIVAGIAHLHRHCVYHGDIKPSNVFIAANGHLKIGDFGESKMIKPQQEVVTCSGTLPYCAPEVLFRKPHSGQPDWWSCGVMAAEMLTGFTPFCEALEVSDRVAYETICYADINSLLSCSRLIWPCAQAKDLVKCLLTRDFALRLSEEEVLKHELFNCIDVKALHHWKYTPPFVPILNTSTGSYFVNTRNHMQKPSKEQQQENHKKNKEIAHFGSSITRELDSLSLDLSPKPRADVLSN